MPIIRFTPALQRFFPSLKPLSVEASNVAEALSQLEAEVPGLRAYLVDDQGQLRQHVNIFLDGEMIEDEETLTDSLAQVQEVFIMQALSGGSTSPFVI